MNQQPPPSPPDGPATTLALIGRPTAWLPMAMSLAALLVVLVHVARFGIVHEADEGTAAHIFQLLIAGQVPVVAFFTLKWLPRLPGPALRVLVLQALASVPAFAAVYWLT